MSETCIVCLGDLESANALPHPLLSAVKSEDDDHAGLVASSSTAATPSDDDRNEMIAHLLPCGHDLHNECLKPWVERANSCPICRQNFNQVELVTKLGGPVISSYAVSDRTQIADVDPSMLIEDYDDDEEEQPCPTVWDNLNLDLDFPFDDGGEAARIDRAQRASSERGGLRQWERRLHVAERQGGVNRFRETASTLLDVHATREKPEISSPESREEIRAWNAFEKAKEIELDPAPKRKRKSATTSPSDADPAPQSQRPLKRPRTRRTLDHAEASSSAAASGSRRGSAAGPSSSHIPSSSNAATQSNGPSFLQSMLREIETSSAPDETKGSSHYPTQSATNHSSPQPSSPGASPTNSNYGTPRARSTTPPPSLSTRPGSPLGLTSKVEPIFPPPEFSPTRSPLEPTLSYRPHDSQKVHQERRVSRTPKQGSSPPGSKDTSPARANMPLSLKSDLQKMVTVALKPYYHSNAVSKDQYTDINRNVSHMLYDKVGENGMVDEANKETWERVATDEVAKAVQSLKAVI
ncbi:hypothetical protein P7C71_g4818, partial [Lecanoromycetidae sp. Uapishka_2]